jgi:hypothetical protein
LVSGADDAGLADREIQVVKLGVVHDDDGDLGSGSVAMTAPVTRCRTTSACPSAV